MEVEQTLYIQHTLNLENLQLQNMAITTGSDGFKGYLISFMKKVLPMSISCNTQAEPVCCRKYLSEYCLVETNRAEHPGLSDLGSQLALGRFSTWTGKEVQGLSRGLQWQNISEILLL